MSDTVYYKVGFIVCWALIILVSVVIFGAICFILYALMYRLRRSFRGDKYGYYLGRVIKTETLRKAYSNLDSYPHLRELCLKYRLRNIKKYRKWS